MLETDGEKFGETRNANESRPRLATRSFKPSVKKNKRGLEEERGEKGDRNERFPGTIETRPWAKLQPSRIVVLYLYE